MYDGTDVSAAAVDVFLQASEDGRQNLLGVGEIAGTDIVLPIDLSGHRRFRLGDRLLGGGSLRNDDWAEVNCAAAGQSAGDDQD